MQRRAILKTTLAAAVCCGTANAHTPYKQWEVYRKKHLLVGCLKDTPKTYKLAKEIVELFSVELPRASARVARAPHSHRIASLMATDQLDTSIIPAAIAADIASGSGVYSAYGAVPLSTLYVFGDLLYVGQQSIPEHHALMIYDALHSIFNNEQTMDALVPWHSGIAEHKL